MMALVSNDTQMIQSMSDKDCVTAQQLEDMYQHTTFALRDSHREPALCSTDSQGILQPARPGECSKFILPGELSWYFGSGFLVLQCLVAAGLVYTYISADLYNGNVILG